MTWKASPVNSKLERISFRFPNDLEYDYPQREYHIGAGATSITIDPLHVGMEPIYQQLSLDH